MCSEEIKETELAAAFIKTDAGVEKFPICKKCADELDNMIKERENDAVGLR